MDENVETIKREHARDLSVERFINEYESKFIPVVIDGIPEEENWKALDNWTFKVSLLHHLMPIVPYRNGIHNYSIDDYHTIEFEKTIQTQCSEMRRRRRWQIHSHETQIFLTLSPKTTR